jgi:hypothetical protein
MADQPTSVRPSGEAVNPVPDRDPGTRPQPEPLAAGPSPCLCPCGGRLNLERSKWRCANCCLFPEACCNGARG